jgi:hypothetical protein
MAQLLRIQPNPVSPDFGARRVPVNSLQIASKGLGELGDDTFKIAHGAEVAEATKLVGEGSEGILTAIQRAKLQYDDPEEFQTAALEQATEVHRSTIERASTPGSRRRVEALLANNLGAAQRHVEAEYFTKKKDRARADTDQALELLSRAAISDGSPQSLRAVAKMSGNLLGQMKADNYYTAQEVTNISQAFEKKIIIGSANAQIRTNAESFLVDVDDPNGKYARADLDTKLKLKETARKTIEDQERRQDKLTKEVREIVERGWSAAANQGKISDAEMQEALTGQHPYITPDKARQFKTINENPSTGEGGDQVRVLRTMYRLTEGTERDVRKAMSDLRRVQSQLGKPSKLVDDFANELQSDLFRAQNQGISRENVQVQRDNRAIRDIQTSYDAWVESNPFLKKLLGNVSERDKARLADTYKKQGPEAAKTLLDSLTKQGTTKKDSIEQKHGPALNW